MIFAKAKTYCGYLYRLRRINIGGNYRARTYDPLLVRQMLSQLSYAPKFICCIVYLKW